MELAWPRSPASKVLWCLRQRVAKTALRTGCERHPCIGSKQADDIHALNGCSCRAWGNLPGRGRARSYALASCQYVRLSGLRIQGCHPQTCDRSSLDTCHASLGFARNRNARTHACTVRLQQASTDAVCVPAGAPDASTATAIALIGNPSSGHSHSSWHSGRIDSNRHCLRYFVGLRLARIGEIPLGGLHHCWLRLRIARMRKSVLGLPIRDNMFRGRA